jgi:hypothetical protein
MPKRLAEFIDQGGGGFPLVTIIEHNKRHVVLWQYEKQDIILRCMGNLGDQNETLQFELEAPVEFEMESISAAFELIRHTECIRQNYAEYPYLQFGPMPGTRSDLEFFFHRL